MDSLSSMIKIELLKISRSKGPLLSAVVFLILPLAAGLMIFILKDPEFARKVGILSMKAELMGSTADWPTYLGFLGLMSAMGGLIFFSLLCSWIFGREFSDGTLKDWLAVPVSRSSVLLAKFVGLSIWSLALVVEMLVIGIPLGMIIGLGAYTPASLLHSVVNLALTSLMTILVIFPFAFFTGLGRGYLVPMGVAMLALIASQLASTLGWGNIFPWAIPGMYADLSGKASQLTPLSFWIVAITSLAGIAATLLWFQRADQSK